MSTIDKLDKLSNESRQLGHQILEVWNTEVLFSWRWWVGVSITILTWLFWVKFHKKESRYRLLTAGFFVMVVSLSFDAIGVQIGLWSYRYEVIPFIPAFVPYNLALMPVVVMSLIQYKPNISPYLKAAIFGLGSAFVGEPLVAILDIYNAISWKSIYSVPIYAIIFLIGFWLSTRKKYKSLG